MWLLLPLQVPNALHYSIYWNHEVTFNVAIEPQAAGFSVSEAGTGASATQLLLNSTFPGRLFVRDVDFAAIFSPSLSPAGIQSWIDQYTGSVKINDALDNINEHSTGLIRDLTQNGTPHILNGVQFATSEDILSEDAMDVDIPDSLAEQLRAESDHEGIIVLETSKLSKR